MFFTRSVTFSLVSFSPSTFLCDCEWNDAQPYAKWSTTFRTTSNTHKSFKPPHSRQLLPPCIYEARVLLGCWERHESQASWTQRGLSPDDKEYVSGRWHATTGRVQNRSKGVVAATADIQMSRIQYARVSFIYRTVCREPLKPLLNEMSQSSCSLAATRRYTKVGEEVGRYECKCWFSSE